MQSAPAVVLTPRARVATRAHAALVNSAPHRWRRFLRRVALLHSAAKAFRLSSPLVSAREPSTGGADEALPALLCAVRSLRSFSSGGSSRAAGAAREEAGADEGEGTALLLPAVRRAFVRWRSPLLALLAALSAAAMLNLWSILYHDCLGPLADSLARKTAHAESFFQDHPIDVRSSTLSLQTSRAAWHRAFRNFTQEVEDDFDVCSISWYLPLYRSAMNFAIFVIVWFTGSVIFRDTVLAARVLVFNERMGRCRSCLRWFLLDGVSPRFLFRVSIGMAAFAAVSNYPSYLVVVKAARLSTAMSLNVQQLKELQIDVLVSPEGSAFAGGSDVDLFAHLWEGRRLGVLLPVESTRFGDLRFHPTAGIDRRVRIDRRFVDDMRDQMLYQRLLPGVFALAGFWWFALHKRRWQSAVGRVCAIGVYDTGRCVREGVIMRIGSGSLVHPAGLILTNWHLLAPWKNKAPHDFGIDLPRGIVLCVGTTPAGSSAARAAQDTPIWQYEAEVVTSSPTNLENGGRPGGLDVAVLRIKGKLVLAGGKPGAEPAVEPDPPHLFRLVPTDEDPRSALLNPSQPSRPLASPLSLPYFELQGRFARSLRAAHDDLFLLGFPNLNLTVAAGGFYGVRFDNYKGSRGKWLISGVQLNMGNSGGSAVDAQGRLVGIPSQMNQNRSELRCVDEWMILTIHHAVKLCERARATGFVGGFHDAVIAQKEIVRARNRLNRGSSSHMTGLRGRSNSRLPPQRVVGAQQGRHTTR